MKKILVPTDFNSLATAALEFAVPLARATGAEIIVLYADTFEPPAEFTATQMHRLSETIDASRASAARELEIYAHEHVPEDLNVTTVVREALAVPAIVEAARDVDLVVMGTHGRGPISRMILGSVAQAVLEQTDTPVLTVTRKTAPGPVRRILTYPSTEAKARELAAILGAEVAIVERDDFTCCETDLLVVPKGERTNAIRHAPAPVLTVTV
ncbi:MAG: universal stress protein [Thermoanaerobaculia bacterium]